jgi:hypothetical protein
MAALWAVRAFCAAGLLLLLDFTWGSFCLQASAVVRSQKSGRCVQAKGEEAVSAAAVWRRITRSLTHS